MPDPTPTNILNIYQGTKSLISDQIKFEDNKQVLIEKVREFFNLKNVNFLFGSGTSSGAIETMSGLYTSLTFDATETDLKQEFNTISEGAGKNLEKCLTVMYAARAYYDGRTLTKDESTKKELYDKLIKKVETHIFNSINVNPTDHPTELEYYKTFYQKLALRNKDNSRIRVFTTNNDLFNEYALDALNIHYINGFSGGLQRTFNPAIFNYTWSKRMDTSIDKYEPVENMVYLYKIHGSVNWKVNEDLTNNYFEIEEVGRNETKSDGSVLIYPTPTKQDKSLGSPYVDLFREFQNKLLEPHSVLFVIGYGFNDRHVNDIIYRALATNSTINVVIFGRKPSDDERTAKPIFFIDDKRIFTINGEYYDESGKKHSIYHFDYIVNNVLPNLDAFSKDDDLLHKFVTSLKAESDKK